MAIHFACGNPQCGKSVRAPSSAAGKKARCPFCQTVQTVPEASGLDDDLTAFFDSQAGQPAVSPPPAARPVAAGPPPADTWKPKPPAPPRPARERLALTRSGMR